LNGYNHDPYVSAKKLRRMLKWRASYRWYMLHIYI
jgi:hypothetical protein